jgi:hypothetical protein
LLLLGEDGVGELGVAYLLGVGFLLHEGEDLRTCEVFWDLFLDVLLEDQLAIAFGLGWLVLVTLLALLLLLFLFVFFVLFFFLLLLLLLFLLFLLLLLFLLFFLLVLVLLGRVCLLWWLLLVGGRWLDGLVGLVEVGLDGALISLLEGGLRLIALLERWLLWILEVVRLVQVTSLLRLVEVCSLRLVKVCSRLLIVVPSLRLIVILSRLLIEVAC